jgi:hypothetical protein
MVELFIDILDKTFTDLLDFDICIMCFNDSTLIAVALIEGRL